jgi:hypothetical protein
VPASPLQGAPLVAWQSQFHGGCLKRHFQNVVFSY